MLDDVFDGLGDAQSNQTGLYFLPGTYVVAIAKNKLFKARDGITTFVTEADVIESTNPERPMGCRPAQLIKIGQYKETALGNIKHYLGAALGIVDPDNYRPEGVTDLNLWWKQTLGYVVSDDQPLAGTLLRLNCVSIVTRKGSDFTKHTWAPLLDEEKQRYTAA